VARRPDGDFCRLLSAGLWWRLGAGPISLENGHTVAGRPAIAQNIGNGNTVEVGGTQIEARPAEIRIAVRIRDIVVRDSATHADCRKRAEGRGEAFRASRALDGASGVPRVSIWWMRSWRYASHRTAM